jgi:hypothetical protein
VKRDKGAGLLQEAVFLPKRAAGHHNGLPGGAPVAAGDIADDGCGEREAGQDQKPDHAEQRERDNDQERECDHRSQHDGVKQKIPDSRELPIPEFPLVHFHVMKHQAFVGRALTTRVAVPSVRR